MKTNKTIMNEIPSKLFLEHGNRKYYIRNNGTVFCESKDNKYIHDLKGYDYNSYALGRTKIGSKNYSIASLLLEHWNISFDNIACLNARKLSNGKVVEASNFFTSKYVIPEIEEVEPTYGKIPNFKNLSFNKYVIRLNINEDYTDVVSFIISKYNLDTDRVKPKLHALLIDNGELYLMYNRFDNNLNYPRISLGYFMSMVKDDNKLQKLFFNEINKNINIVVNKSLMLKDDRKDIISFLRNVIYYRGSLDLNSRSYTIQHDNKEKKLISVNRPMQYPSINIEFLYKKYKKDVLDEYEYDDLIEEINDETNDTIIDIRSEQIVEEETTQPTIIEENYIPAIGTKVLDANGKVCYYGGMIDNNTYCVMNTYEDLFEVGTERITTKLHPIPITVKITREEIANKFNCSVDELEIIYE